MHSKRQLPERLHSLAIHLLRWVRRVDEETPLPAAQLSALSVLVHRGPLAATALAREEQVAAPTMTRTVDVLAKAGLAQRSSLPGDRRQVLVDATDAGRAVLAAAARRRTALLGQLLEDLPDVDRRAVETAVDALASALAAHAPRR